MDSHDSEPKIHVGSGFRGFVTSEISKKPFEFIKKYQNVSIPDDTKGKIQKDDSALLATIAKDANRCDNKFPNINQEKDSYGYVNCDKKANAVEIVDVIKHIEAEETEIDIADITPSRSLISCTNTSDSRRSPDVKPPDNIQSSNILIQEVVDRVNQLDIVEKSNTKPVSSVVLKNENSSLRNLLVYHSDSSDDIEDYVQIWQHQLISSSSSSSDSESDSQECVEISDDDDDDTEFVIPNNKNSAKTTSKPNREQIDILPLVDLTKLQIDYEKELFVHIGHITNFINATVTIDALENTDSYDIETVLFIDNKTSKRPLGGIGDVIGPVSQPMYCVQLPDPGDIEKLGLKEGLKVYSAPKSVHTKYIFLKDLLKMRGTDASWIGDEEQSTDDDHSSGEEIEKDVPRKRGATSSLERHRRFEKTKNKSNIIKNQLAIMRDANRLAPVAQNRHTFPHGFDPLVPPPPLQNARLFQPRQQQYRRRFFGEQSPDYRTATFQPRHAPSSNARPYHNRRNYFARNSSCDRTSAGPSHENYNA